MTAMDVDLASGAAVTRWRFLGWLAAALAALLLAGLALQILRESGGTNSYAALADSFLHGRLDVERCFDGDCARYGGRNWVIFPPFPAIVTAVFVSVFGLLFHGFTVIAVLLTAASAFVWWRIVRAAGSDRSEAMWFLAALLFATPLYYVTIRADGVWFFAQSVAFLLTTLALYWTLVSRKLWLAGVAIGLAFLTRQMSIFYLPFLFLLSLPLEEGLFRITSRRVVDALKLGLPVAACLAIYLIYNDVRFADPFNTGYGYIAGADADNFINHRIAERGLFSPEYLVFNLIYLFAAGFHLDFGGPRMTEMIGLDPNGTSILAASPFLLLLFFVPFDRRTVAGFATIALIAGITLFYHSNGFSQYGVQRYALDWLPIAFYLLIRASAQRMRIFSLLCVWGMSLTTLTMIILALTHDAPPATASLTYDTRTMAPVTEAAPAPHPRTLPQRSKI